MEVDRIMGVCSFEFCCGTDAENEESGFKGHAISQPARTGKPDESRHRSGPSPLKL